MAFNLLLLMQWFFVLIVQCDERCKELSNRKLRTVCEAPPWNNENEKDNHTKRHASIYVGLSTHEKPPGQFWPNGNEPNSSGIEVKLLILKFCNQSVQVCDFHGSSPYTLCVSVSGYQIKETELRGWRAVDDTNLLRILSIFNRNNWAKLLPFRQYSYEDIRYMTFNAHSGQFIEVPVTLRSAGFQQTMGYIGYATNYLKSRNQTSNKMLHYFNFGLDIMSSACQQYPRVFFPHVDSEIPTFEEAEVFAHLMMRQNVDKCSTTNWKCNLSVFLADSLSRDNIALVVAYKFDVRSHIFQRTYGFKLNRLRSGLFLYQVITCQGQVDTNQHQQQAIGNIKFCYQRALTERPIFIPEYNIQLTAKVTKNRFNFVNYKDLVVGNSIVFTPTVNKLIRFRLKIPNTVQNYRIYWSISELWSIQGVQSFKSLDSADSNSKTLVLKAADLYGFHDAIVAARISSALKFDYDYVKFAQITFSEDPFIVQCVDSQCELLNKSLVLFGYPSTPLRIKCLLSTLGGFDLTYFDKSKLRITIHNDPVAKSSIKAKNRASRLLVFHPIDYGDFIVQGTCPTKSGKANISISGTYVRESDDYLLGCRFDRTVVIALRDPLRLKCRSNYKRLHLSMWVYVSSGLNDRLTAMLVNENSIFATRKTTYDAEYILHSLPLGMASRGYRLQISVRFIGSSISRMYEIISLPMFGRHVRISKKNTKREKTKNDYKAFFADSLRYFARTIEDFHQAKLRFQYDQKYILSMELSPSKLKVSLLMRASSIFNMIQYFSFIANDQHHIQQLRDVHGEVSQLMMRIDVGSRITVEMMHVICRICSSMLSVPRLVTSTARYAVNSYFQLLLNTLPHVRNYAIPDLLNLCDSIRMYYSHISHKEFPESVDEIDHAIDAIYLVNTLILKLIEEAAAVTLSHLKVISENTNGQYSADMISARTFKVLILNRPETISPNRYTIFLYNVNSRDLLKTPIMYLFLHNELVLLDELKYGVSKLRQVYALLYAGKVNHSQLFQENADSFDENKTQRKRRQKSNNEPRHAMIKYITPLVARSDENFIRVCELESWFNVTSHTGKFGNNLLITLMLKEAAMDTVSIHIEVALVIGRVCNQPAKFSEEPTRYFFHINPSEVSVLRTTIPMPTREDSPICLQINVKSQLDRFKPKRLPTSINYKDRCILYMDIYETSCNAHEASHDLIGFYKATKHKQCEQVNVLPNETLTSVLEFKMACLCLLGLSYVSYSRPLNYTVFWTTKHFGWHFTIIYLIILLVLYLITIMICDRCNRIDATHSLYAFAGFSYLKD